MTQTELLFLPLGGCREIGMNLNAYAYGDVANRRWIIVDVGVTFGDHNTPGIDLIMPDPSFLETEIERIEAIILTHAHEDHIGAIAHLWPRLRAPIYATPFTMKLVEDKLGEQGLLDDVELHLAHPGEVRKAGVFEFEYIHLTHSIPEPHGLMIRTPAGVVFHTGDWKIDPNPLVGRNFDEERVKKLGDDGVLAMVCDSTNVFVEGEAGSEETVRDELIKLVGELDGRVAITTFASNVARLESCCVAAQRNGRSVALVGRSMFRITDAAQSVGFLKGINFIEADEAAQLPPENVLYLCTGSQGEPRAALSRIARGDHPHVELGAGDAILFSSRVIPGNEREIFDLQNMLAEKGVEVITDRQRHIHVSGHPCRDELRRMYQWVRPEIAVPVHGERRHVQEHARLAKTLQVAETVTPNNGELVRLWPGDPEIVDEVPSGRLYLDGAVLTPENAGGLIERKRLSYSGYISVSIALDAKSRVKDGPVVISRGFSESDGRVADESLEALDDAADTALARVAAKHLDDDEKIEKTIGRAVRKAAEGVFGKRPIVDVTVLRV